MNPSTDAALHRRGLAITGLGGLALSFDIPLIRSAGGEVWSLLAVRSLSTFFIGLLAWFVLNRLLRRKISLIPGKTGLVVGLFYGINSCTFLLAVFNTSTANVVFILAFTSMFAALLSWIFLKERPSNATLVTMAAMVIGVGLIVQDGLESGHIFGDAMAASSAFLLASAITISRASGRDMALVPLVTAIFPAAVALLLLPAGGFAIAAPQYILFNGLVMIPLAFFCLATGPRSCRHRKWVCSICSKPSWHRSGSGLSSPKARRRRRLPAAPSLSLRLSATLSGRCAAAPSARLCPAPNR